MALLGHHLTLKNTFFSPSLPIFPTFFRGSRPLLLLPLSSDEPSWGPRARCQGSERLAWAGCGRDETARMHCPAEPCASGCTATQGHRPGSQPAAGASPADTWFPAPLKGWVGVSIPDSRKDSADGAQREAWAAHSKCSKFLAGQNRVCWVYLFIFGGGEGYRREKVMI